MHVDALDFNVTTGIPSQPLPCEGCARRAQWIRDNPIPVAGLAFVAGLLVYLVVKGR